LCGQITDEHSSVAQPEPLNAVNRSLSLQALYISSV
jgi:hypothetical protein